MNIQDTVEFVHPELCAGSSPDVEVLRTRHKKANDTMKAKLKAGSMDPGTKERTQTRKGLRQMKYPTNSPGRGSTLMPTNLGRMGTGRTPGGRMGSANY